jgi:hypothetical protein
MPSQKSSEEAFAINLLFLTHLLELSRAEKNSNYILHYMMWTSSLVVDSELESPQKIEGWGKWSMKSFSLLQDSQNLCA